MDDQDLTGGGDNSTSFRSDPLYTARNIHPFCFYARATLPCRTQANVMLKNLGVLVLDGRSERCATVKDPPCVHSAERRVPVSLLILPPEDGRETASVWPRAGDNVSDAAVGWNVYIENGAS